MNRPALLLAVLGTATGIGKTWVAAGLLAELRRRGRRVAARKPVQSFDPGDTSTDAEVLAAATGEEPDAVCPPHRSLPVPMAPPMAADVLGTASFTADDLLAELACPPGVDVAVVETVGGVRSPMTDDADSAGFAARLGADGVVLVADAALGTINAVRLSMAALDAAAPVVVVLNRFDPADDVHVRNRDWLRERDGLHVVTSVAALTDLVQSRLDPRISCDCNRDPGGREV